MDWTVGWSGLFDAVECSALFDAVGLLADVADVVDVADDEK